MTIDGDDSFGFLVFRLNQILESAGRAEVVETFDGERLEVNALHGSIVEFLRGPYDFDTLTDLGLKPMRLFGDPTGVFAAEAFSASAFALGFFDTLNVLTREAEADTNIIVENAEQRTARDPRGLPVPDRGPEASAAADWVNVAPNPEGIGQLPGRRPASTTASVHWRDLGHILTPDRRSLTPPAPA